MSLRSLSWLALGGAVVHLTVALTWRALTPVEGPGALMPAAGGAIETMAIQFHRTRQDLFLPVYGELFGALSPNTQLVVVVADVEDQRSFEAARATWFPTGGGPDVTYAHTGLPITSWARDRLSVLPTSGPHTRLLAPPAPMPGAAARISDWTVPWTLAEHLGPQFDVHTAPFQFEGGDLVADDSTVYVATPLLERTPDADVDALLSSIQATVGRPVLALGADGTPVPDHHIGMFLTPLGGGRVAVADARWGQSLLPDGPLEVGGHPFVADARPEVADRFDAVATQLEAHGREVVRVPAVPSTTPYAWMSYNNVLAEHRDGALHVYLPTYGIPEVDAAARAVWEAQRATVHPIDVSRLFWRGGSVRCLTAPLERAPRSKASSTTSTH